jgi:hypothetical protein
MEGGDVGISSAILPFACIIAVPFALCQQGQMQGKPGTEAVKNIGEQQFQLSGATGEARKHREPEFGYLKCRADAQKWTSDPFDSKDARNLSVNTAKMVNGQFRSIPRITPHVTVNGLLVRVREMEACTREDADFERQFATYSAIARAYGEEHCFRYMYFVTRHHLEEQFLKEDTEENK